MPAGGGGGGGGGLQNSQHFRTPKNDEEGGLNFRTFFKKGGGRTGQPTILNTLTIAGGCSERPKLIAVLASKWGDYRRVNLS